MCGTGRPKTWQVRFGSDRYLLLTLSQVFKLSSKLRIVDGDTRPIFLEEFRVMFFPTSRTGDYSELVFFNTLVPQYHPSNLRRLRLPQRFCRCSPFVTVDAEMPLGNPNQDGAVFTDPTQALLIASSRSCMGSNIFTALRIHALIARVFSVDGDTNMQWDELGRDAVIMEFPENGSGLLIQGAHAIQQKTRAVPGEKIHAHFRIFDFSRRGFSLLFQEGTEAKWMASSESGQGVLIEGYENVPYTSLCSLGNGTFYYLVSCLCRQKVCGTLTPSQGPTSQFGPPVACLGTGLRSLFLVDHVSAGHLAPSAKNVGPWTMVYDEYFVGSSNIDSEVKDPSPVHDAPKLITACPDSMSHAFQCAKLVFLVNK